MLLGNIYLYGVIILLFRVIYKKKLRQRKVGEIYVKLLFFDLFFLNQNKFFLSFFWNLTLIPYIFLAMYLIIMRYKYLLIRYSNVNIQSNFDICTKYCYKLKFGYFCIPQENGRFLSILS